MHNKAIKATHVGMHMALAHVLDGPHNVAQTMWLTQCAGDKHAFCMFKMPFAEYSKAQLSLSNAFLPG